MTIPEAGRANPRADSFSLYAGWVANRVLLNILPKSLLENKLHRTMRNNRKKAIERKISKNNLSQSVKKSPSKFNAPNS